MKTLSTVLIAVFLNAQTPKAADLAKEIIAKEIGQAREFGEFTFRYEVMHQRFSAKGVVDHESTEAGESYMSHRQNIDIKLERNGKPLKPKDLDKIRKAAILQIEADAKLHKAATYAETPLDKRPGPGFQRNDVRMSAVDVLRYCKLTEPRAENNLLAIDFDQCNSPWPHEAHYPHLRGSLWIDTKSRVLDNWKAFLKDGPQAGAVIFEQTTQLGPGGTRVPAFNRFNLSVAPHVFPNQPYATTYRWTNPQRFGVSIEQAIADPKQ